MKINCLIIDDESLARKRIYNLVKNRSELDCIGQAQTGKLAINMINELQPDLIFLDIQMKDMNGFNVLKEIAVKSPLVIFVTAFDEFAVKAFEFFAFDYLLKPFKKERFDLSIDRVISFKKSKNDNDFGDKLNKLLAHVDQSNASVKEHEIFNKKLPIKIGKSVSFIDTDTIKYIKASGSYIDIFTTNKSYVLRDSLSKVLKDLKSNNFSRIHRSTVVNINYISNLIHSDYGEVDVKMTDNKLFRISNSYKSEFLSKLGIK
jgi:two-component system LytT family response regulator